MPLASPAPFRHRFGLVPRVAAPVAAALVALVALVTQVAGGGSTATALPVGAASAPCRPLTIGYLGRLTGDDSSGRTQLAAARLAAERYSATARCPVTVTPFDLGADGSGLTSAVSAAVDDPSIVAVIGPERSGEVLVAGPGFEYAHMPFVVTAATRPDLGAQGWTTYHRLVGGDTIQGAAAARWITKHLHPGAVGVVDDGSPYGSALAAAVRKDLGATPVVSVEITPGATDQTETVAALSRLGANDAVYFAGYPTDGGRLLAALRAAGNPVPFLGGDSLPTDSFLAAAGGAAEGVVMTCACTPPARVDGGSAFVQEMTTATGTTPEPGEYAAESYDAADLILTAIGSGARTRDQVERALDRIRHRGLVGTHSFDRHGESMAPKIWVYRVEGGRIVPVEAVTPRR